VDRPKPLEFGTSGQNWEGIGWRVKVKFTELGNKVRPKDHIEILRPLLPDKYSPLQPNGNGFQSVYLVEVPATLAEVLIELIGQEVAPLTLFTFSNLAFASEWLPKNSKPDGVFVLVLQTGE